MQVWEVCLLVMVMVYTMCKLLRCAGLRRAGQQTTSLRLPSRQAPALTRADKCRDMTSPLKLHRGAFVTPCTLSPGPRGQMHTTIMFGDTQRLFLVDTGYAGPLVLNTWQAAREDAAQGLRPQQDGTEVNVHGCKAYATDCAVRLAGIASATVRDMDLVTCDDMAMGNGRGSQPLSIAAGERLVLLRLERVAHIMTIDYMLSFGGARLDFAPVQLVLGTAVLGTAVLGGASGWTQLECKRVHGAFAVKVAVSLGSNAPSCVGWYTLDTGSSVPLVMGKSLASKLDAPKPDRQTRFLQQSGVNGERTCGQVIGQCTASILTATSDPITLQSPLVINDTDTHGVDGYIDLEVARRFGSMVLLPDGVYVPTGVGTISILPPFLETATHNTCGSR